MIFVDTSFLVAFAVDGDPHHTKAKKALSSISEQKCISEDVMKETLTVVSQRKGKSFCIEYFEGIDEDYVRLPVNTERYQAGLNVFLDRKLQKNVSLIDCISAAICHELGIKKILSFDGHFKFLGLKVVP